MLDPMYQQRCKKSNECDKGDVCDSKQKTCRQSLRKMAVSNAVLAKECLSKGIPIVYERGQRKDERKEKPALRRCKTQKDRTIVPYHPDTVKLLGAPSMRHFSTSASTSSGFQRPSKADLAGMTKAELVRIYHKGQVSGYIDPSKSDAGLTNKQLANAIGRATQKLWL